MDGNLAQSDLYDPRTSRALVVAHRPAGGGAASDVVSDALWSDVLAVVRWAEATLSGSRELLPGVAWRTAAASAVLLRRLPAFCDERGECWRAEVPSAAPVGPARRRLREAAGRLGRRLREIEQPVALCELAVEIDAVGAAAVGLLAERADWRLVR